MLNRNLEWEKRISSQLSPSRWQHTQGALEIGLYLANIHSIDEKKAYTAIILHDIGKAYPLEEQKKQALQHHLLEEEDLLAEGVIHAKLSAYLAQHEYDIHDEEILFAIAHHSTGHANYNELGWLLYVSDYLDPYRKLVHQKTLLALCEANLCNGCLEVLRAKIEYLFDERRYLHSQSVHFYNRLITLTRD